MDFNEEMTALRRVAFWGSLTLGFLSLLYFTIKWAILAAFYTIQLERFHAAVYRQL